MCIQNLKSVALPIPEIIGGSQKILDIPWLCPHSMFPKSSIGLPYRLFMLSAFVFLQFLIGVLGVVANL